MRKICLMLAIAGMLALPGMSFGDMGDPVLRDDLTIHADWTSGGVDNAGVIDFDPSVDGCIYFDVMLYLDIAMDGVQFDISIDGGTNNSKWKTCDTDPWEMNYDWPYPGFKHGWYTPTPPPPLPDEWINEYLGTIGNASADGSETNDDYPNTQLDLLPGAELYFKGSGKTYDSVTYGEFELAEYCIMPAEAMAYSETYVIDLYSNSLGKGSYAIDGENKWSWDGADSRTITVHIVPEPVSALFLLAGLPFLRRRR